MAADNIVKLENINAPRFRNEWSPTTVVALLTLIGMIIGIGAMWQRLEGRIDLADRGISQLNTNAQVLDAGCGTGYLTDYLPQQQWNIVQLDIAYAMCQQAFARNNTVLNADLVSLPFPDSYFDGTISSLALQWVNDNEAACWRWDVIWIIR